MLEFRGIQGYLFSDIQHHPSNEMFSDNYAEMIFISPE
jgi:hypothetical protein